MSDPAIQQILEILQTLQSDQKALTSAVDAINGRVNALSGVKELKDIAAPTPAPVRKVATPASPTSEEVNPPQEVAATTITKTPSTTSKIILTTYPGQGGMDPIPLSWGAQDPEARGPVVVGRGKSTIRRRNGKSASCSPRIDCYLDIAEVDSTSPWCSWWLLQYI